MKRVTPMTELMQALEASKDIELPMDPAFYDRLHVKIMTSIGSAPPRPSPWYEKPRSYLRSHWRSWLSLGGVSGVTLSLHLGATLVAAFESGRDSIALRSEDRAVLEENVSAQGTPVQDVLENLVADGVSKIKS